MRSRKLALSCTSRIRASSLTDHSERVRHAAGHGDPVPGSDDQLVVATAHDHLALEDVPGVVEVVVDVQRGRRIGLGSSSSSSIEPRIIPRDAGRGVSLWSLFDYLGPGHHLSFRDITSRIRRSRRRRRRTNSRSRHRCRRSPRLVC